MGSSFKRIASIRFPVSPAAQVHPGVGTVAALDASSRVWAWGSNTVGNLGDNTTTNRSSPNSLPTQQVWIKLASTRVTSVNLFALDANSYAWAWGTGTSGQLGDNTATTKSSPVSVVGGMQWRDIKASGSHAVALDGNSYAWAWGGNSNGMLGDDTVTSRSSPVSVVGDRQFRWIDVGSAGTIALDSNSYAWAWGTNTNGAVGDDTITNRSSPVSVVGGKQWLAVQTGLASSHWALDSLSYAWAWGLNSNGQLGDNSITNRSSPVSVVGDRQFLSLASSPESSSLMIALDSLSYAWAWGSNSAGQLGNNTANSASSPVSVVGGKQWRQVVLGSNFVVALDANSYAWAWGTGTSGQMGEGTVAANRSSPVSVAFQKPFTSIRAGGSSVWGVDADGIVWAWGASSSGVLGDGTSTTRSSPVSVRLLGSIPSNPFGLGS
jgi:alpha-tubulin suppressor-like RCC1 family protein